MVASGACKAGARTTEYSLGSKKGESMAGQRIGCGLIKRVAPLAAATILGLASTSTAMAWNSSDGSLVVHGFVDYTQHNREGYGLVKNRFRHQLEANKEFGSVGMFRNVSLNGIVRMTHDGAYVWNEDQWGDEAGGRAWASSSGIPNGTANGFQSGWGTSPVNSANGLPLPGGGDFTFDLTANPDQGLKKVSSELGNRNNSGAFGGGLELFAPQRPCDEDIRGCINNYMDGDKDDLQSPEFTDEHRWLRELYVDATLPFSNGDELNFRIGRQQVVWGRTDLFRVLDQINPIDFSIQNIYEEFEDSRIPLGIFNVEWRLGGTQIFSDLNFQFLWNFEQFTPHNLGQGGQPYSILKVGDAFRALKNCWDNGCTVSNFASGLSPFGNLATDFPAHAIGIRGIHIPDGHDQFGLRMEGVFKSVGFSVNAAYYHSQLPSLRAGIPSVNPFLGIGAANPTDPTDIGGGERPRTGVPAFDIHFPRVLLVGTSADFYIDKIKSAFRVELAWTDGEEFADTSKVRLFSESDVIRWVVGWDRPTYIRFLNPNRTFLLSGQVFGQHLLNYDRGLNPANSERLADGRTLVGAGPVRGISDPVGGQIGFQDWEYNFIGTFLIQGFYANDRIQPRLITAYDIRAQAGVIGPAVDWLINDSWRMTFGANVKFGKSRNNADDGRTVNGAAPFTAGSACTGTEAACVPGLDDFASLGSRLGYEPLGRFRSGPIGMAQDEDELQLLIRYRF